MAPSQTKKSREWMAHFWHGCDPFAWLRIYSRGRFHVAPKNWHIAAITTVVSIGHLFLRYAQKRIYADRMDRSTVDPPVFVLGHWRTGTTLLHELLVLDPHHTCPNTYQCFDPCHPLLTENLIKRFMGWMLPSKRPMDNMQFGWNAPQEDEFALCLLGAPSPYADLAFPRYASDPTDRLELDRLPAWQQDRWRRLFREFVSTLGCKDPRRLVLKSPTHTSRIPTLIKMFPSAKFVHIVRNPYVVFPSTMNLWRAMYETQGFHSAPVDESDLRERVLATYRRMYERIESTRSLVPVGQWHELKYEELTADPEATMRRTYEALELETFDRLLPPLRQYLYSRKDYQKNRWELSETDRREVRERWGFVADRYGYPHEVETTAR